MKLAYSISIALGLAASQTSATSDHRSPAVPVASFHYDDILGTSLDLKFITASSASGERAERIALAEIERLRHVLSSWDSTSEVSQLFSSGSLDHPSAELVSVLRQYADWNARSGGAYSARVGELATLWNR
jgi:thiamine biosynthesis lipoprotein